MTVIGIDPAKYGYNAAVLVDGQLHLVSFSAFSKGLAQLPYEILGQIADSVGVVIATMRREYPDQHVTVFCEEAVSAGARNLRTYGQLAMSVGAIISACFAAQTNAYLVPVSKWKQTTVGKGGASKDDVALWLSRVHSAYSVQCDGRQDLIDATCIALHGSAVLDDAQRYAAGGGAIEAV